MNDCCAVGTLLHRIGECDRLRSDIAQRDIRQFAALDSYICDAMLPLIGDTDPCGSSTGDFMSCIKPQYSMSLTVLALCLTYIAAENIVVFSKRSPDLENTLLCVSMVKKRSPGAVILVLPFPSDLSNKLFTIRLCVTGAECVVSESKMISLVSSFTNKDMSLVIYAYGGYEGYSSVIELSKRSIWANLATGGVNMMGSVSSKVLPMFARTPSVESIMRVNVGQGITNIGSDTTVLQGQLNLMATELLGVITSDGTCFFCKYLNTVHNNICGEKVFNVVRLKLSSQFEISL